MNCLLCYNPNTACNCDWNIDERDNLGNKEAEKWFKKTLKPPSKENGKIIIANTPGRDFETIRN